MKALTTTALLTVLGLGLTGPRSARLAAAGPADPVIPFWPGIAPGSETWTQKEVEYANPQGERMVRNVVRPTLTAFLPDPHAATRTAVIVCPGGSARPSRRSSRELAR